MLKRHAATWAKGAILRAKRRHFGHSERGQRLVRMDEADVGIRTFLSEAVPGFSGVYKARYADFIVREVEPDGTVVRMRAPATRGQAAPPAGVDLALEDEGARAALAALAPEELEALEALAADTADNPRGTAPPVLLTVGGDKAARTAVHRAIRALFPALDSETAEGGAGIRGEQRSHIY
jgi:hypothetical protein